MKENIYMEKKMEKELIIIQMEQNMKESLLKIKKKETEFFIGMKKLNGKEHG